MRTAVLGASGRAGRCLVDAALDGGHQVRAVVRRPGELWSRLGPVEVAIADVRDVPALERAVDACDAVVWAVGGRDAVRTTSSGQRDLRCPDSATHPHETVEISSPGEE